MGFLKDMIGGGINSNTIKSPFGISGVGNIGLSFGENGPSLSMNFNNLLKKKVQGSSVANGPLSKLYSDNPNLRRKISPLQFPLDLDSDHFMIVHIVERNKHGVNSTETKNTLGSIVLPLPSNLTAQYGVDYQNKPMGIAGSMMMGHMDSEEAAAGMKDIAGQMASKGAGMLADAFGVDLTDADANENMTEADIAARREQNNTQVDVLGGLLAAAGVGKMIGGGTGALVAGVIGGAPEAFAGAMSAGGMAVNPHMAVLFEGVGFREYQFEYKFVAKSKEESDQLRTIIYMFKKFMHPGLKNKLVFTYPEEFEIEFSDAVKPYLFQPQRCVLKSFNVNYNGEGMPVWFEDTNAPVSITMSMSFQETKIITKETIEDEYNIHTAVFSEN